MKKIILTIVLFLAFLAPLEGADNGAGNFKNNSDTKKKEVLFKIGERVVTRADLDMRMKPGMQKRRGKPSEGEIKSVAERLAEQMLFAQGARSVGLDREAEIRILINDTVDRLLAELYVRRHVIPGIRVSEGEIKAYYDNHPEKFKRPERVRASHILLRVSRENTEKDMAVIKKKAEDIRSRLDGGEDFASLAKAFSEDTGTMKKGGDLGFFNRNGKIKAISDRAFAMKKGEISQPVKTSVGFHIIKVTDRTPAGIKPLDDVREDIRTLLLRERRKDGLKNEKKRLEKELGFYRGE